MSALPLPEVPDALCEFDLDPMGRETTSDLQTLRQDVLHVLLETAGSNIDDPNRGIGALNYLSGSVTDIAKLPAAIEQQLLQDDRIDTCDARLTLQQDGGYLLAITVGVNGAVVPLNYAYDAANGLTPIG